MIEFWYSLVKNNKKTIEQVPLKWRELVQQKLNEEEQ